MQTFRIVKKISSGVKRVDGRLIDTLMATVDFGDDNTVELATRHLRFGTIRNADGAVIAGPGWLGRNSDRTISDRKGILATFVAHEAIAKAKAESVKRLESDLASLKGKRGITETRNALKAAVKATKAAAAQAKTDLARVKAKAEAVNETHPEIVEFK